MVGAPLTDGGSEFDCVEEGSAESPSFVGRKVKGGRVYGSLVGRGVGGGVGGRVSPGLVGANVTGLRVGKSVGAMVGLLVGSLVGERVSPGLVGLSVTGLRVGKSVGSMVGDRVSPGLVGRGVTGRGVALSGRGVGGGWSMGGREGLNVGNGVVAPNPISLMKPVASILLSLAKGLSRNLSSSTT